MSWVVRWSAGWGSAGHLVVAVNQVVVQGGLGGGVHGAGLGETGLALQVLDGGGGLGAHDAVDRAFVVVELAQFLLQLLHRGGGDDGGVGRGGRLSRVGRGRGGGRARGGRSVAGRGVVVGQADGGQGDQGGGDDGADGDDGGAVAGPALVAGGVVAGGGAGADVVLGAHGESPCSAACFLLMDPVSL